MGLPKPQKLSISSSGLLARSVQYVAFWPFASNFTSGPHVSFRGKAEDLLEGDAPDRVVTVAVIRRSASHRWAF